MVAEFSLWRRQRNDERQYLVQAGRPYTQTLIMRDNGWKAFTHIDIRDK
ncbi:hypothetical protein [Coleofasciculus chthonoplastes]|jgi:hypothetical protein